MSESPLFLFLQVMMQLNFNPLNWFKNYRQKSVEAMQSGFLFFMILIAVLCLQFFKYLFDSQVLQMMGFGSSIFYLFSCISHSACIALIPYLVYIVLVAVAARRTAATWFVIAATFVSALIFVNEQVYNLYRFHINGIVLNMFFGKGAGEIFTFDWRLYLTYTIYILMLLAVMGAAWWASRRWHGCIHLRQVLCGVGFIVFSTLFAHVYHVFASFYNQPAVVNSAKLLPYYFPTTAYTMLVDMGLEAPENVGADFDLGRSNLLYPVNELEVEAPDSLPNILLILIDSWNSRSLDKETMPRIYEYAQQHQWYDNHYSGSNGTRSGVFGIFFGMSSYYWPIMESNHCVPVMLDVARDAGYTFRVYPSAEIYDPPFNRVLFAKEKDLRIETPGETSYERDIRITRDIIADLQSADQRREPFFSFLFYDLPHSYIVPKEKQRFQPAWEYAQYDKLSNDTDPTPFWNLYRATCYEADSLVGTVLDALEHEGLADNTVVIISGDHSQEFNENKKGFWGHNGNFSHAQSMVPLVCSFPGEDKGRYHHRTTHYDLVPTLMKRCFGVRNDESDYSMGHDLQDRQSRDWHVVGSELNYAFIVEGDTIIEKTAEGSVNITDKNLNPCPNYVIPHEKFNKAVERLNHFLK